MTDAPSRQMLKLTALTPLFVVVSIRAVVGIGGGWVVGMMGAAVVGSTGGSVCSIGG